MATLTEQQIWASESVNASNQRGHVETMLQRYSTFQFHREDMEEL